MSPAPNAARRLAAWLNYLFLTHLTPTGRPWTFGEVGKATDLSPAYIRLLRIGGVSSAPPPAFLATLAAFFDVPMDDLTRIDPPPIGESPPGLTKVRRMMNMEDLHVSRTTRLPGAFDLEIVAAAFDSLDIEKRPDERDRLAQALAENAARAAAPRAAFQEYLEQRRRDEAERRRAAPYQPPAILRNAMPPAPPPAPWRRFLASLFGRRDT